MKSILYVQYTDPAGYPPLEHSSLMLADRGWTVRFVGIGAAGAANKIVLPPHPSISVSLNPVRPQGWRGVVHYASFLAKCFVEARRLKPDVVYCSDLWSYPVGLWASAQRGLTTVMHEHDPPGQRGNRLTRALLWTRRCFARRAPLVVIPQDERARKFIAETGADATRVRVVYNCPSQRELGELPLTAHEPGRGLKLWFHGTIGRELVPPALVEALARLPSDVTIEIAGYETVGSKGYGAQLMERAQVLGIASRMVFHGAVPLRSDLLKAVARADVGLALFPTRFRDPMVGASNKPFDYLACGLPLLTNRTPEWETFFGSEGVSIGCDPADADDIARAVLALRNDPARRLTMRETGRRLIETRWNYETQFEPVLRVLEAAVGARAEWAGPRPTPKPARSQTRGARR